MTRLRLAVALVLVSSLVVHSVSGVTIADFKAPTFDCDTGLLCRAGLQIDETSTEEGVEVAVHACYMIIGDKTMVVPNTTANKIAANTDADYQGFAGKLLGQAGATLAENHCHPTKAAIADALKQDAAEIIMKCRHTSQKECTQCMTITECTPPTPPPTPAPTPSQPPPPTMPPQMGASGSCLDVVCELCRRIPSNCVTC